MAVKMPYSAVVPFMFSHSVQLFFCAMLRKRGLSRHAVYVSVCLSVTFVHSVKTKKHMFNFLTIG